MSPTELDARFPDRHPAFTAAEAVVEANRCLNCYDAPCMGACPTHIDVPKFIKKIATGNLRGSAHAILEANVLGLSCSRVCPVETLCEGACVMHRYNREPIEIGRLQRHAMEHFYDHSPSIPVGTPAGALMGKKVACVGGGPASRACAAELRRAGVAVTVFEKSERAGGLNTYGIAQYKLRPKVSQLEVDLIERAGVEFRLGHEVDPASDLAPFDAVFIGAGLGKMQSLGVPGDDGPNVIDALRYIAEYKVGTPRAARRVVVVGAGNTAMDAAIAAKRLGADDVHLVYRRSETDMPAFSNEYDAAKLDGVLFHWNAKIVRVEENALVCEAETIPCDLIIPAIGQSKVGELLTSLGVKTERGLVAVERATGQTSNPRYFAGGDCVNGGREVVDAVADGKRAAKGILQWLT